MGTIAKIDKTSNVECWICKGPHKKDCPNKQPQGQENINKGHDK